MGYKGNLRYCTPSPSFFQAEFTHQSYYSSRMIAHSERIQRSSAIILHFSPTTSSSYQSTNTQAISQSSPYLSIFQPDSITDLCISLSVLRQNTINTTIMFRKLGRSVFSFATAPSSSPYTRFFTSPRLRPFLKTLGYGSVPAFMYYHYVCLPQQDQEKNEGKAVQTGPVVNPKLVENPKTFWEKVRSAIAHTIRFLHLIFIFLPPIIALPLRLFKRTEKAWLSLFVGSVERAGVVWIKAFQYLSHRRDVIGPEMADAFTHLRENAPQHSFQETKRNFKTSYGKEIHDIFSDFDPNPIASGSVSQVYKAVYQGKKVAVKVRHPQVDKYIQRDVNILFGISRFFSLFSKAYQIPVGEDSLKKTLIDQIDFNIQKENLAIFNRHFIGNKQVNFPYAFQEQTRDSILIESFVEGVPVTYFQNNKHPLNAVIARLGATAFFEMLMKNNFIHADCHGGNILVELTQQSTSFFGEIWEYIKEKCRQLEGNIFQELLESDTLRSLYKASRQEEERIRGLVRQCTEKVRINLIDVGMVIKLDDTDRRNFVNFIKSVIEGNSEKCAAMIYNLSNFEGKKILEGRFSDYKTELRNLFSVLENKSIFDIEGIELMVGMLNIIRLHNMKLDGQFATLLTNMVVLQSIAKEIDPTIQILKCAVPYFKFVEDAPSASSIDHQKLNAVMA